MVCNPAIKVGVIEDEVIIADSIKYLLEELKYDVPEPCSNFEDALALLNKEQPDLLLIDINLEKGSDGIEVGKYIREHYDLPFIFLTANSDVETVTRAKKVNPNAYLVKPFHKDDLYTAIEIALANFKKTQKETIEVDDIPAPMPNPDFLFIREGNYHHKIKLDDILYMESDHVYVTIKTVRQKFLVRASLQNYIDRLDTNKFIRTHRRYLVNFDRIEKINNVYVVVGEQEIPLSKNYRDTILKTYSL